MKRRTGRHKRAEISPVIALETELAALRRDLRATVRAYAARLEVNLAESAVAVSSVKAAQNLSRERLAQIRQLMVLVRSRKFTPEKGRRKDLRKIDALIRDVYAVTHPERSRGSSR